MTINVELADQLGISEGARKSITYWQDSIVEFFEDIKSGECNLTPKHVVECLEVWEFRLQDLWGFAQDSAYHKYWNFIPGCTCPKLDNSDLFGSNYRVITGSCPYHGENVK